MTERRLETTGGATFELPASQGPAPQAADTIQASQRVRLQRRGEPEFILREGVLFTVSGTAVSAADVPEWAMRSIAAAASGLS